MSSKGLENILVELIPRMTVDGSFGSTRDLPEFDYYAFDYLDFAEQNLEEYLSCVHERKRENELISCASNLKRALDNQIECFLESWNLRSEFLKRNLGLDTKLRFLEKSGIIKSRTINRFGRIRNKLEHGFRKPEIDDLESLFDLVTALISILQNSMTSSLHDDLRFCVDEAVSNEKIGFFRIEYDSEKHSISASWGENGVRKIDGEYVASLSSQEEFTYFFRVLILLNRFDSYTCIDHILGRIRALSIKQ